MAEEGSQSPLDGEVAIELFPWDAGTDNGASYESGNADAVPAQPISLRQRPPV